MKKKEKVLLILLALFVFIQIVRNGYGVQVIMLAAAGWYVYNRWLKR